jgi:hypothetical protein
MVVCVYARGGGGVWGWSAEVAICEFGESRGGGGGNIRKGAE